MPRQDFIQEPSFCEMEPSGPNSWGSFGGICSRPRRVVFQDFLFFGKFSLHICIFCGIYGYMLAYMHICRRICIYAYMLALCAYVHMYICWHVCLYAGIYAYMLAYMHICIHVSIYAYMPAFMQYMPACMHIW